jgi:hypothetical protein
VTPGELVTTADLARVERKLDELLELFRRVQPPAFCSIAEACSRLGGIDRATLAKMIRLGEVRATKARRRWLVEVESLRLVAEARGSVATPKESD